MKLDNVNVSCIKCIGYYVTQVANVTVLVYPRNSSYFLATYMIGLLFYLKNSDDFRFHNIQLIILYIHKLILFQLLVFFNALK